MKHEINVPKGCKVVSVEIISVETTDKMVVVKFEKEEPEFKENDIVSTGYDVAIIDKISGNSFFAKALYELYSQKIFIGNVSVQFDNLHHATDSEKQLLFDKLKEKCLMFDGENVVRWRADPYRKYFYLLGDGDIAETKDNMSNWDNEYYNIGNCFPTREMAEAFQKQYLELLNNFHKNL